MHYIYITGIKNNKSNWGLLHNTRITATEELEIFKPHAYFDPPFVDSNIISTLKKHSKGVYKAFSQDYGSQDFLYCKRPIIDTGDSGYRSSFDVYANMCLRALVSSILGYDITLFDTTGLEYLESAIKKDGGGLAMFSPLEENALEVYRKCKIPNTMSMTDLSIMQLEEGHEYVESACEIAMFNATDCLSLILTRIGMREMEIRSKTAKALYKLILSLGIPWWLDIHSALLPNVQEFKNGLDLSNLTNGKIDCSFNDILTNFPTVVMYGLIKMWNTIMRGDNTTKDPWATKRFVFPNRDTYMSEKDPVIPGHPFISILGTGLLGDVKEFIDNKYYIIGDMDKAFRNSIVELRK